MRNALSNVRREHHLRTHARTTREIAPSARCGHPAVGITSTEPGGEGKAPQNYLRTKTICKRFGTNRTYLLPMVCAHCGSDSHRTGSSNCPNYCTLCNVAGHRQKRSECAFRQCSKCKGVGHSARACKATQLQQQMVRGEREPESDHSQTDAPMATGGDKHADDDDDECDQLNSTELMTMSPTTT